MDNKALYNLSYGVFLLGTTADSKINACITNTCFQAANSPVRIAISVIKQNLTCQMIEKSGVFSLSVLDKTCTFDVIKRFGYQSGRTQDKFKGFKYELASNGCPYIKDQACSLIEAKVVNKTDIGTHMLFIAEVTDAKILSTNEPLTYADYQRDIKPRAQDSATAQNAPNSALDAARGTKSGASTENGTQTDADKKIVGWRCKICGYVYNGSELPPDFICPLCGHPADDFEPIYE